ncbi:protein translocase subunit SecD [bacterium]|nr:protein translocase subunit SecD [bacterium]
MKQSKIFRTLLILVLVVLALYYLYPTVRVSMLNKELEARLTAISDQSGVKLDILEDEIFRFDLDPARHIRNAENLSEDSRQALIDEITALRGTFYSHYSDVMGGSIKLGLDLKGGMHLVLEVNFVDLMDRLAKNRDADFAEITDSVRTRLYNDPTLSFEGVVLEEFKKRDIKMARYFGDPRQSDQEIIRNLREQAEEAVNLTLTKLRNRVDEFGVAEPSITKQGSRRIVVELPGVQDPDRARSLIGRTALLEFKLLASNEISAEVIRDIDTHLAKELKKESGEKKGAESTGDSNSDSADKAIEKPETDKDESMASEDSTKEEESSRLEEMFAEEGLTDTTSAFDEEHPFSSQLNVYRNQILVTANNRNRVESYLARESVRRLIPPEYEFLWGHKLIEGRGPENYWNLYLLRERAELTGSALADAQVNIGSGAQDPTQAGAAIVNLTMKRDGARKFSRITGNNTGEFLAIVLDDKVHMAPQIRNKIPNGQAIIEGSESIEEASDLAIVLRAGALPAPVEIIEERTVGPSLGADSIRAGTLSAIVGLVLVIIFMAFYYRASGLIADLALVLNIVFLMAVLAGFGFTLTLPGIAGIILTIGMAVDANVLIFERIREELETGKTVWNAINAGFGRAFVTIMDANITTLIAGLVLYQFGTGPIRGFALTLMIGIVASMFTALVVSRALFDWITSRWSLKKLSI